MRLAILFLVLTLSLPSRSLLAQGESVSLTSPVAGQVVFGVVTISGSAAGPQFQRYELEFGYEPNPTDTWFPIVEPVYSPQPGGVLAQWDTAQSGIADGVYLIRLRMFRQDGAFAEAFIHNLLLQNGTAAMLGPTAMPALTPEPPPVTPTPVLVELPPTSTPRPTATPRVESAPFRGGEGGVEAILTPSAFVRAFLTGAGWALGAFALLGLYAQLRPFIRPRLRQWIRSLGKAR